MPANHILESAFKQLLHGYSEFGRSPISIPVLADSEGLSSLKGYGTLTLTATEDGFTVTFKKAGKP